MSSSISILMAARQVDDYFHAALASCLQAAESGDEIVVVIDGPQPEGLTISDPRVRIIVLGRRLGTPSALNAGLRVCSHEIVFRLDADDIFLPGRRDAQLARLEGDDELVLIGGAARLVSEDGEELGVLRYPTDDMEIRKELQWRNAFVHSSVAFRRSRVLAAGGYDEACLRMQDYELFLRLSEMGKVANLDSVIVEYRIHGGMSSRTSSPYATYTLRLLRTKFAFNLRSGSMLTAGFKVAAWWTAQVLRYHGVRGPRYQKGFR